MRTLLTAVLLATGCTGAIVSPPPAGAGGGSGGSTGTGGGTTTTPWQLTVYSCDPARTPPELPLKRLSRTQYVNAVRDLVRSTSLSATDQTAVLGVVDDDLARFPDDRVVGDPAEPHGGYSRLDQAVQQAHIDVSYDVAVHTGAALVATTTRKSALLGACATDGSTANDAQCLSSFITSFGRVALRRPLTTEEVSWYAAVAGATPVDSGAVGDIVALMLTGPQFLYHVEEGDPTAPGPVLLDAHALAARLSFHFWQTSPDAELRAAADSGALLTDATYQAQVQRLLADPRTDAALDTFFAQWFRLADVSPLNGLVGTAVFDAFAGTDAPAMDLNLKMQAEVLDATRHVTRSGGTVNELLTSKKFFARTPDLAKLYGQPAWDGAAAPVDFVEPERAGLLTRAAFLASGSGNTRPVIKGYRVRNALLCEKIPPPPNNVNARPIELSTDLTTRETVEAITQQPGSSCLTCHGSLLNPLGFVTENFDALGRHRTEQRLFNPDGTVKASKPIDTTVVPHVVGLETSVSSAAEVTTAIADSGAFQTCFAREYFRYSFGRIEKPLDDGCTLAALQSAARQGKTVSELLAVSALSPAFKHRDFR